MNIRQRPALEHVRALLDSVDLPWSDLEPELEHFFCCGPPEAPEGVVGLEVHPPYALLRSLVVASGARGKGCGKALVEAVEHHARRQGVTQIYLLTETAEAFFQSLGYAPAARDEAPPAIRQSREFSDLCPASAAFMYRDLAAG